MGVEIVQTCPLGNTCEEIKEGKIHRCRWYVRLIGKHPQTGAETDEWGCAVNFAPVLIVEAIGNLRGVQAATESLRNESVNGAVMITETMGVLADIAQQRRKEIAAS